MWFILYIPVGCCRGRAEEEEEERRRECRRVMLVLFGSWLCCAVAPTLQCAAAPERLTQKARSSSARITHA